MVSKIILIIKYMGYKTKIILEYTLFSGLVRKKRMHTKFEQEFENRWWGINLFQYSTSVRFISVFHNFFNFKVTGCMVIERSDPKLQKL